ncbi:MAG: FecCD family ABC transporter permease [Eisenbergiella massiliensis]
MTDSRKKMRACIVLAILAALLILGIWVDINAGYRHISPEEIWNILWGKGEKGVRFTLLQLRLPRVLASLLAGAGLSVSGCVIQGVSRNEMAEPGILGINAGAGLFVAAFIVFSRDRLKPSLFLPLLAFAGSLAAALCGYRLALTRRGLSPGRLLLTGIAMSTVLSSVTTMLMLRMSDSEYAFVQNWLAGSLWGADWPNIRILSTGLLILLVFVFYKSRTLNVLALGHQTATGLGVGVSRQSVLLLGAAVAMSACAARWVAASVLWALSVPIWPVA